MDFHLAGSPWSALTLTVHSILDTGRQRQGNHGLQWLFLVDQAPWGGPGWTDHRRGESLDYQPTDVGVAISRYLPTGVLDTQFGTYGKVAMSINQQERTAVYSMNIQDDGKVLVCGMAGTSATGPREALVMRFMRGSYTGIPDIEQDLSEASWYRNADGSLSVSYSLDRPGSVQFGSVRHTRAIDLHGRRSAACSRA